MVISTLTARDVLEETGRPLEEVLDHRAVTLAYVRFYDARGGGVERRPRGRGRATPAGAGSSPRSRTTSRGWG